MPRLLLKAEMQKMAQLQDADGEGRKQAHIDTIMSMVKRAAKARAWATMMGGMAKEALVAQKAVGKVVSKLVGKGARAAESAVVQNVPRASLKLPGGRPTVPRGMPTAAGTGPTGWPTPGHLANPPRQAGRAMMKHPQFAAQSAAQGHPGWIETVHTPPKGRVVPPPPGSMKPGAAERVLQQAPAPTPTPQPAGPVPGQLRPAIQPMQGVQAPKQPFMQRVEGELAKPVTPAEMTKRPAAMPPPIPAAPPPTPRPPSRVQQLMSEAGAPARIPSHAAPTLPSQRAGTELAQPKIVSETAAAGAPTPPSRIGELQPSAPAKLKTPAMTSEEMAGATEAGLQKPKAQSFKREMTPAQREQYVKARREARFTQQRGRLQDYEARMKKDPASLSPKEMRDYARLQSNEELMTHHQRLSGQEAHKKSMRNLALGIGLPVAALGYGAYKTVPHVVGALGQASAYPMAPGGGWSPVDYGYGSNPYGPGALNLGPGA